MGGIPTIHFAKLLDCRIMELGPIFVRQTVFSGQAERSSFVSRRGAYCRYRQDRLIGRNDIAQLKSWLLDRLVQRVPSEQDLRVRLQLLFGNVADQKAAGKGLDDVRQPFERVAQAVVHTQATLHDSFDEQLLLECDLAERRDVD